jgi:hypothetical protein
MVDVPEGEINCAEKRVKDKVLAAARDDVA